MYAIVRTGGKQYKVKAGDRLKVELLKKFPGDEFDMEEVLFIGGKKNHLGTPLLSKAKVRVVVTNQKGKAKKIVVFKKKRRHGYQKTQGHRQLFTELLVKSITPPDGESSPPNPTKNLSTPKKEKSKSTGINKNKGKNISD